MSLFAERLPYLDYEVAGKPRRSKIRGSRFLLGSAEDADLRVQARGIAPEHVVLERRDTDWVLVVRGLNRVTVGDAVVVRDRTLASRDRIDLDGVLALTFVDPEVEAAERRRSRRRPETPAGETRSDRGIVAVVGVVSALTVAVLVAILVLRKPAEIDFTVADPATIAAALAELPACLDRAAAPAAGPVPADGDFVSAYWKLARATPRDPAEVAGLQATLRRHLLAGMRAEKRGDKAEAGRSFQTVRALVPDMRCPVHRLAAARLAARTP